MEDQRGWVIAEKRSGDGLSVVRLKEIEDDFEFRAFPERFNVIWDFRDLTDSGSPSSDEFDALRQFEDRICERVEACNSSILCIVFTEPTYREYVFQSRTVDGFLDAVNSIPQEAEPYPIEIHHEFDSDFGLYRSFAERLRRAP